MIKKGFLIILLFIILLLAVIIKIEIQIVRIINGAPRGSTMNPTQEVKGVAISGLNNGSDKHVIINNTAGIWAQKYFLFRLGNIKMRSSGIINFIICGRLEFLRGLNREFG